VFLDEAGFLMAPLLRRTWAPQGHTPELRQRTRQHKKVSAIATLCIPPHRNSVHCVFRLYPDQNIDGERVIGFLRALLRHLKGPIVLLWDSLKAHRARVTTSFVEEQARLHLVILPSYAPELNPVSICGATRSWAPWPISLRSSSKRSRRSRAAPCPPFSINPTGCAACLPIALFLYA
jgi:hypothetical protein